MKKKIKHGGRFFTELAYLVSVLWLKRWVVHGI